MEKNKHVKNQIIYITNSEYEELHSSMGYENGANHRDINHVHDDMEDVGSDHLK